MARSQKKPAVIPEKEITDVEISPEGTVSFTMKENQLETKVDDLANKFEALLDMVTGLADKVMPPRQTENERVEELFEGATSLDEPLPTPRKWRDIVNNILGSDFDVKVEDSSEGNFIIFIYLPENLDRRIGEEKLQNTKDYSTGLVRRASATADVEYWCEKIKKTIQKMYPNFKN